MKDLSLILKLIKNFRLILKMDIELKIIFVHLYNLACFLLNGAHVFVLINVSYNLFKLQNNK